jgi:hypothetical protein
MADFVEYLYAGAFGTWLALTVLWQFEPLRDRSLLLRRVNVLRMLPIWTFFAPRPGMSDTLILHRDRLADGSVTPWAQLSLIEERRWYHWLWNPRKRLDKLAVDAVSDVKAFKLLAERSGIDEELARQQVKLSKGYLLLLNIAACQSRVSTNSTARQFVIVEATHVGGQRALTPLFVSPFHQLQG